MFLKLVYVLSKLCFSGKYLFDGYQTISAVRFDIDLILFRRNKDEETSKRPS